MIEPRKRTKALNGRTRKFNTGCGNIYVTINRDSEGLFEIFALLGKAGGCGSAQLETITRCISTGLRYGIDPAVFVKQLTGIKCPSPGLEEGEKILSCADALAKAIGEEIND